MDRCSECGFEDQMKFLGWVGDDPWFQCQNCFAVFHGPEYVEAAS